MQSNSTQAGVSHRDSQANKSRRRRTLQVGGEWEARETQCFLTSSPPHLPGGCQEEARSLFGFLMSRWGFLAGHLGVKKMMLLHTYIAFHSFKRLFIHLLKLRALKRHRIEMRQEEPQVCCFYFSRRVDLLLLISLLPYFGSDSSALFVHSFLLCC